MCRWSLNPLFQTQYPLILTALLHLRMSQVPDQYQPNGKQSRCSNLWYLDHWNMHLKVQNFHQDILTCGPKQNSPPVSCHFPQAEGNYSSFPRQYFFEIFLSYYLQYKVPNSITIGQIRGHPLSTQNFPKN